MLRGWLLPALCDRSRSPFRVHAVRCTRALAHVVGGNGSNGVFIPRAELLVRSLCARDRVPSQGINCLLFPVACYFSLLTMCCIYCRRPRPPVCGISPPFAGYCESDGAFGAYFFWYGFVPCTGVVRCSTIAPLRPCDCCGELADAVRSARAAYTQFWNARLATTPLDPLDEAEKVIPKEAQPDFMEATVLPLWRKVEMTWPTAPDSLLSFGGPHMPVWFSPFRRAELQRQLEVLCFFLYQQTAWNAARF